jgi:hypothetical protein
VPKIISAKISPNSKNPRVEKLIFPDEKGNDAYKIYVKSIAKDGKANDEVISKIADIFNIPTSNIKIISGFKSRNKIIQLNLQ